MTETLPPWMSQCKPLGTVTSDSSPTTRPSLRWDRQIVHPDERSSALSAGVKLVVTPHYHVFRYSRNPVRHSVQRVWTANFTDLDKAQAYYEASLPACRGLAELWACHLYDCRDNFYEPGESTTPVIVPRPGKGKKKVDDKKVEKPKRQPGRPRGPRFYDPPAH